MRRGMALAAVPVLVLALVQANAVPSWSEGLPNPNPTVEPEPTPEPEPEPTPEPEPDDPSMCVPAPYAGCAEADLTGRDLRSTNLTGANFIRATLDRADLSGATVSRADFVLASLVGATIDGATMLRTDFTGSNLSGISIRGSNAEGLDATHANLTGANLANTDLTNAVLRGADLRNAVLEGATLTGADFTGATWVNGQECKEGSIGTCITDEPDDPTACVLRPGASCAKANLTGRDLTGLDLTGADLTEAVLDDVKANRATFSLADVVSASVLSASMKQATLSDGDFTNSDLSGSDLTGSPGVNLDASWSNLSKVVFAGANLTNATLGGSRAIDADFADVNFTSADLSAVNFARSDLRGANFTNATMRGSDLRQARITGADFSGADLSNATWTNGRVCAEPSIGRCKALPPGDPAVDQASLGDIATIIGIVSGAINIAKFVDSCRTNLDKTGSCFDQPDQRQELASLAKSVAELRKQIEKNQEELRNALNRILEDVKFQRVAQRYQQIATDVQDTEIAALKMQELLRCVDALDRGLDVCSLTNSGGLDPQQYAMDSLYHLYRGVELPPSGQVSDWRPSEDLQRGGPVARFLYATLYRFGKTGASTVSADQIRDKGRLLQSVVAGDRVLQQDGLLPSIVAWENARLTTAQQATTGSVPSFIPGSYLTAMNQWVDYFLQIQASYYASTIAAFALLAPNAGARSDIVKELQTQAEKGSVNNPQWGLPKQYETYYTDLSRVGIDPSSTVDVWKHSDRPERVGFVLGGNGTLYRVQHVYGATDYASAYPDFDVPTFQTLDAVSQGLARTGVKLSTLQGIDSSRYVLPGGTPGTWWARFGSAWRVVDVAEFQAPPREPERFERFTTILAPTSAPEAWKWGDNVTQAYHTTPCVTPVRMWDSRPTYEQAAQADGADAVADAKFFALRVGGNRKSLGDTFRISMAAGTNFNQLVTTGAAPAFNVIRGGADSPGGRSLVFGTGALWKCGGGRANDLSKSAPANWVSVKPVTPSGVLAVLYPDKPKAE